MRLCMRNDLEPGGFLGGDLCLLHPALAFGVGARGDIARGGVARDPEGVVQIAAAQVFECPADLPPH